MKNRNPNFHSVEEVWSPEARGLAYIVFSGESGKSDQTDINRTVFLDPLGQWSSIREFGRDWAELHGGRQGE